MNFRHVWRHIRPSMSGYVLMVVLNASDTDVRIQTQDGGVNKYIRMGLQSGGSHIVDQWKESASAELNKRNRLFELVAGMDTGLHKHLQALHKKGSYTADQLLEVCAVQLDGKRIQTLRDALAKFSDGASSEKWNANSVGVVLLNRQFTLHSNAFVVHHECCVPGGWTCVASRGFHATLGHFLSGESVPCFLMVVESSSRFVEEIYENQRWLPIKGWGSTYLPFERPPFTDRFGRSKDKISIRLPRGWRWTGTWTLSSEWLYSSSFDGQFIHYCKPTSLVRKRKWTRVMERTLTVQKEDEVSAQSRQDCLSPVVSNHSCESGEWERVEDCLP